MSCSWCGDTTEVGMWNVHKCVEERETFDPKITPSIPDEEIWEEDEEEDEELWEDAIDRLSK